MMKTLVILSVLCSLNFTVNAQCPDENSFSFEVTGEPQSQTFVNCNLALNPDHILDHENFYAKIGVPNSFFTLFSDNYVEVKLYEDNNLIFNFNSYVSIPGSNFNASIFSELPGVHVYKVEFDYNNGCTDFYLQDTLEIFERDCPHISANIVNRDYCFFPDDGELHVVLESSDPSATILNTTWQIDSWTGTLWDEDSNFYDPTPSNVGTFVSSGTDFYYSAPYPGNFHASGISEILLSDGTTCLANVDGYDCNLFLSLWIYSDPFFELEGDVLGGTDIDVIFKGNQIFPTNFTSGPLVYHRYWLLVNGVQEGSAHDNLQYNELIDNLNLSSGNHTISLIGEFSRGCRDTTSISIYIDSLYTEDTLCESCNTFKPKPGERYWVSAWVKEDHSSQVKAYENSALEFVFTGSGQPAVEFFPTGDIIDGWQRIVGSFTIPAGTTDLDIKMVNDNASIDAYFDDIRIHPFNASMKSYVYDPETFWLTAELDDNNYATFYEYDNERQLIRIKKETARGIMTIQESRSSNPKSE